MILATGIQQAYETKWSMANTFTVKFDLPQAILDNLILDGNNLDSDFTFEFGDQLNLHVISIETPDITNEPIEVFTANQWRIGNGRDSVKQFTMTFRDHNQMSLYRKFLHLYDVTRESYFNDVAMTIKVMKDADWGNEKEQEFIEFSGAIVMGVSNLSLSNANESQIAEFSVTFKCVKMSSVMLKNER